MPHRRPFHVHFHSHRTKSSLQHHPAQSQSSKKPPHHTPVLTLCLPSSYDETSLECRIYHPFEFFRDDEGNDIKKAAIVAHPYGPLSTGFDDMVVMSMVEVLVETGWIVATFNFRFVLLLQSSS